MVDPAGLGGVRVQAQAGPVRDAWLALLRSLAPAGLPLLRLPLHISDDRLLGGVDLAATLALGRPVLQQGLLAQADGGLLLAAMAERLSRSTAAQLCAVLDQGEVRVERDGLSARLPSRCAVVALDEALADDAPLSPALADRLALWIRLDDLSLADRREWATPADALGLSGETGATGLDAGAIARARARCAAVSVPDELLQALCAATLALGVDSGRAARLAVCAARACAALHGREVAQASDAALAARLVLAGRATRQPPSAPEDEEEAPPPPPETPPAESAPEDAQDPISPGELQDQLIEAALASLPPGMLAQLLAGGLQRQRSARGGASGAFTASQQRGRPLSPRRGVPSAGARLHLVQTLRAAAPWQRLRREQEARAGRAPNAGSGVLVRVDDFHIRRHAQRRCTTTIFAIDASGSAALHRLGEAKGAVELLLAECYVRRDEVAVIGFRGRGAEVLLPPTRSLVRAKRSLAGLPGGGGTPLAAGIAASMALADQVRRAGDTPVVVLLTDGRANVTLAGEGGRARAQEDARAAAQRLRALGVQVMLIDTSPRSEPAALALAQALGARYLPLPHADAAGLSAAVHGRRGGRG